MTMLDPEKSMKSMLIYVGIHFEIVTLDIYQLISSERSLLDSDELNIIN